MTVVWYALLVVILVGIVAVCAIDHRRVTRRDEAMRAITENYDKAPWRHHG